MNNVPLLIHEIFWSIFLDSTLSLHLSLGQSTAKVGKTSLIMSLVSEEFPNVVRQSHFGSFTLSSSPFLKNACARLLNWGSLSSWGDNHTCRRHTWEGPHAHCGLFGYFWAVLMFWCNKSPGFGLVLTGWFSSRGGTDRRAAVSGDLQGLSWWISGTTQRTAEVG